MRLLVSLALALVLLCCPLEVPAIQAAEVQAPAPAPAPAPPPAPVPATKPPLSCPDDMVVVPAGTFRLGAGARLPEEEPAVGVGVSGFCMETHPVTNGQFEAFIRATGYVTVAQRTRSAEQFPDLTAPERRPGSLVFQQDTGWKRVPGANWRHPRGPGSTINGLSEHPVVHVALEDARAYAAWAGRSLPTEAQWEYAARGGLKDRIYEWGDTWWPDRANTGADGQAGTTPVGSYPPNGYGLVDMTGNVWEWTEDRYQVGHGGMARRLDPLNASEPAVGDPRDPVDSGVARRVIKGGSFLCDNDTCNRNRPAAREGQPPAKGRSDIGFRLIAPLPSTT